MNNQILSFFLGSIFGFLTSIGVEFFRFYYFRPKLRIEDEDREDAETFSCHSVRVRNVGRRIAKNAQGAITIHDIGPRDLFSLKEVLFVKDFGGECAEDLIKSFDVTPPETIYMTNRKFRKVNVEPLCWSELGNRASITIFPGMTRILDVARFIKIKGSQQIQIPSSKAWQALLLSLRPKSYKITISVGADNAKLRKKEFTLNYNVDNINLIEGP